MKPSKQTMPPKTKQSEQNLVRNQYMSQKQFKVRKSKPPFIMKRGYRPNIALDLF